MFPDSFVLSIRDPVNHFIDAFVVHYGAAFKALSGALLQVIVALESLLRGVPWWGLIGLSMALAWAGSRRLPFTIATGVLMFGIGVLGLWDAMIQTLALILVSTLASVLMGVPAGVLVAKNRWARAVIVPTLDVMQTMPSFVYLIPALMLFGLGSQPAATAVRRRTASGSAVDHGGLEPNDHDGSVDDRGRINDRRARPRGTGPERNPEA
jgi:glycine betaine/proline transport system permease protein